VDAEVVEYLRVHRAEGRIEVHMSLDKDDEDSLKGVLVRLHSCPVNTAANVFADRRTVRSYKVVFIFAYDLGHFRYRRDDTFIFEGPATGQGTFDCPSGH